jgi:hypothetical protein
MRGGRLAGKARAFCLALVAVVRSAPDAGAAPSAGAAESTSVVPDRGDSPKPPAAPRAAAATDELDLSVQRREAGQRYERALELYDEGSYDAALSELKRAYELAPSSRMLYNLGVISLAVRDMAGAMDYLERYLVEGGAGVPGHLRAEIEAELQGLAPHVARVQIQVNVPGAEVSVDDRVVGAAPLGRALRVNVGSRRLSARANGWLPDSTLLSLAGGEERQVTLVLSNPRIAPPPAVAGKRPEQTLPWFGFAMTAVLAAGSVLSGVEALSAQHDFDRKRRMLGVRASELERADAEAFRWSVAADALAVAAFAAGSYSLYVWLAGRGEAERAPSRNDGARLELSPSRLVLSGEF